MSFEGYYQLLCKEGHKSSHDVYWDAPETCEHCAAEFVWRNMVDQTNGSYCVTQVYEQGMWPEDVYCTGCEYCKDGRIDNYVELEEIKAAVYETCECCGTHRLLEPARYRIPG